MNKHLFRGMIAVFAVVAIVACSAQNVQAVLNCAKKGCVQIPAGKLWVYDVFGKQDLGKEYNVQTAFNNQVGREWFNVVAANLLDVKFKVHTAKNDCAAGTAPSTGTSAAVIDPNWNPDQQFTVCPPPSGSGSE